MTASARDARTVGAHGHAPLQTATNRSLVWLLEGLHVRPA